MCEAITLHQQFLNWLLRQRSAGMAPEVVAQGEIVARWLFVLECCVPPSRHAVVAAADALAKFEAMRT